MSANHRQQLSLLSIPPGQPYQVQSHPPLYSPALQSAIRQGFPPGFPPPPSLLQTPIQPSFFPPPSGPPPRPLRPGHHAQASIALAAAGILPPPGGPVTPLAQNQFPPAFGGPQFPPFQPRNRRQPSVSTGGPPKAQLGGAGKNYRPRSPTAVAVANASTPTQKAKKVVVNLPKETATAVDGKPPERTHFARTPIPLHLVPPQPPVPPPDIISAAIHPDDSLRMSVPNTVDVFLPAKPAWEELKKKFIEEKLEKLGVERGSGSSSTIPHIHAPHARAASISSPADPALLFFKLNKLQQAQNSQSHSASVSPQPHPQALNNTTPPPPIIQPASNNSVSLRHGHSLSLAAAPFTPSRPYIVFNAPREYNSLGHSTSLRPIAPHSPDTRSDPGAPTDQSLAPPIMPARADSRPDFMRGFGLDAPDETEEEVEQEAEQGQGEKIEQGSREAYEEEEGQALAEASHVALPGSDDTMDMELDVDEADAEVDSITTAAQSRVHSRHVSRLSAALSLLSVGGHVGEELEADADAEGQNEKDGDLEDDEIGEWTGSEDLRTTTETTEDEESIGEWSNPSDEERARRGRQQRRLLRRAHLQQQQESSQVPRRIPNFPHPPANPLPLTTLLSQPRPDAEEDMISNPSDDNLDRPLVRPFHPSSRPPTSRLPLHDPALAHSRHPSSNTMPMPFPLPMPIPIQAPVPKRTEVLNPHAKPFVYANPSRRSGSFTPVALDPQMQQPPQLPQQPQIPQHTRAFSHARGASLGKPLNAGAPEFKPGTFSFTPPPNVPKFPLPQPPAPPALPLLPPSTNLDKDSARIQQGREKRQRRDSVGPATPPEADDDGRKVMTSFKFPRESPLRMSAPASPTQRQEPQIATARPLVLPGLGGILIGATKQSALHKSPVTEGPLNGEGDGEADADADGEGEESGDMEHELPMPLSMKARRAPIPLDFKHPVSTNTVPAGLFKALANGSSNSSLPSSAKESEDRPRRIVRSRLSSREIFEHVSRPSLDDLCVPAISQNVSRSRLITDPGQWDPPVMLQEPPQQGRDRRASLPAMASSRSSFSDTPDHPQDISRRLELQHYEERLEALLESKLDDFREEVRALRLEAGANGGAGSASTDAAINEVVSLFRAQLQESAARGLDDSQVDARGELDFQLVKDIVEQGHAEARVMIQQDLDRILRRVEALQSAEVTPISGRDTEAMLEDYHARTRNTVVGAVAPITARLDVLERTRTRTPLPPQAPTLDHEALVRELHAVLVPHIVAMRAEPIDYELLTEQLSQAVKPHISQLIDLASDKRETAGLIVDRLIPVLPSIYPPAGNNIDGPALIAQVTSEVRRIVGPLDAHEIKEQVSDLVVERLDSRMTVRDRGLDGLSSKLADGVDRILEPVNDVASRVVEVSKSQEALSQQTRDLASANNDAMTLLSGMPEQLAATMEPLRTLLSDLISTTSTFGKGQQSPEDLLRIGTTVESLSTGQEALQVKATELLALHQNVFSRLTDLPETMAGIVKAAQVAHAELLARTVTKEDFEEVRKLMATNADLQVQLAKARALHGAVRAEKDIVMDRVDSAEAERDQLRAKVDEIQAVMLLRATDAATSQARTTELEEALSQSLARMKTSDVTIESQKERLLELEKLNRELTSEKQSLVSKVHSLESQVGFASRDKDTAVEALATLRTEHDALREQQTHREDLRRTTEQLERLSALVTRSQANEPELKELRRIRDRSKVLESDHAALQLRYKEQEKRADEWEQHANESETALADTQAALEIAEHRAAQLAEEYAKAKAAEERLAMQRENKLRDQVAALEARVVQIQYSAARSAKISSPPRPDSRASTVYPSRAATPTASVDMSRTNTPPTSVWDSMHAPSAVSVSSRKLGSMVSRPGSRFVKQDWPSRVASPTPSVASVAPTLRNDGWYE